MTKTPASQAIELTPGDIVRLDEPYAQHAERHIEEPTQYTHGIVAEIVTRFGIASPYDEVPRNVALYLFNPTKNDMYFHQPGPGDHGIPEFVDFHVHDLRLVQRAAAPGYDPQDVAILPTDETTDPAEHEDGTR